MGRSAVRFQHFGQLRFTYMKTDYLLSSLGLSSALRSIQLYTHNIIVYSPLH